MCLYNLSGSLHKQKTRMYSSPFIHEQTDWGERNGRNGQGCESKQNELDTDNERSPEEENILFKGRKESGHPPLSIPLQAFFLQPLHLAKDANGGR